METFTFFCRKTYILSVMTMITASVLISKPAFSQVDYFYGANNTGLRVSLGIGVSRLGSNWSQEKPGYVVPLDVEYDVNPYFSVGVEGQQGMFEGVDKENKLYFKSSTVTFTEFNAQFKVAVGAI